MSFQLGVLTPGSRPAAAHRACPRCPPSSPPWRPCDRGNSPQPGSTESVCAPSPRAGGRAAGPASPPGAPSSAGARGARAPPPAAFADAMGSKAVHTAAGLAGAWARALAVYAVFGLHSNPIPCPLWVGRTLCQRPRDAGSPGLSTTSALAPECVLPSLCYSLLKDVGEEQTSPEPGPQS